MVNTEFVEFVNYDAALKEQENFEFLIERYKQNTDLIKDYKGETIKEVERILEMLTRLEEQLKAFKALMPKEKPDTTTKSKPTTKKKITKKKSIKKKTTTKKSPVKKASSKLDELKIGLEQIKDDLERM